MILSAQELSVADRLHNVSLSIEPGTITAICGPNGAGKSTLLECLAGLLDQDGGHVSLDGVDFDRLDKRDRARRIGYLPQEHEIAWDVPVRSLVALGRLPHGDSLTEPVDASLAALDIAGLAERRAQSLSGGETARALLARVLAGEPDWILADEPLAALDLGHQLALLSYLHRAARSGKGVVIVLHDLAHAMNHADRVIVLDRGRIAADGPPQEALSADIIHSIYGVTSEWMGSDGSMALSSRPSGNSAAG